MLNASILNFKKRFLYVCASEYPELCMFKNYIILHKFIFFFFNDIHCYRCNSITDETDITFMRLCVCMDNNYLSIYACLNSTLILNKSQKRR